MRRLLISLALWLTAAPVWAGAKHFVRQGGNDALSGHTWDSAWVTTSKVQSTTIAGDTVIFGAGTWYSVYIAPPAGGSNSVWTVYACSTWYTGTTPTEKLAGTRKTIFYSGDIVTGWTVYSGSVYQASWSGTNCVNYQGQGKCYSLIQGNGVLAGDSSIVPVNALGSVNVNGEFYHDNTGDILYARVYDGGDPDDYTMIASCNPVVWMADESRHANHVKFWGLDMRGGKGGTILSNLYPADSFFIEHCHLAFSGNIVGENPSNILCLSTGEGSAYGLHVVACSLGWAMNEDVSNRNNPPWSGTWHGGNITLYAQENVVIESCYIYGYGADGVHFKEDQNDGEMPYSNNVVKFCQITNTNGHAIDITANPDHDSVYGNVCFDVHGGMKIDNGSNITNTSGKDLFICNNTVFGVDQRGITCLDADTCGENNIQQYNLIEEHYGGDTNNSPFNRPAYDDDVPMTVGFRGVPSPCESGWTIDYNMYFDAAGDYGWWVQNSSRTFAYWQGTAGFDVHGDTLIRTDPDGLLMNPAAGDFRPTSNVPYIDPPVSYGGKTWTRYGAVQDTGALGCILSRAPVSFSFTDTLGTSDPASQNLILSHTGDMGTIYWTATKGETWLTLGDGADALTTGQADAVSVSTSLSGLSAGTYYDAIAVADTSDCAEETYNIQVMFNVSAAPGVVAKVTRGLRTIKVGLLK